ncbi:MAG: F0F1 ATP synthase subunit gamma [Alphaproteobacteria bacterium]|nr:F0F1 ATP synthase subunit gamma [Alphaproteobacteria bacterium]
MANLKDLRVRITSVKSTQKITAAMKMVAASKLKRAQDQAEAARPYAERMERMLGSLAASLGDAAGAPKLLRGSDQDQTHLLVVVTSDRGLCGGFNGQVVRGARARINLLLGDGKTVKILCVGRKGRDGLRREFEEMIVDTVEGLTRREVSFEDAGGLGERIANMFDDGEFDVCSLVYNRFKSAISQEFTVQQLIPFPVPGIEAPDEEEGRAQDPALAAIYEFEPDEETILADLLPRNLGIQMYRSMLESYAGEQGARMAAMDNATRNAGEMIDRLELNYNRTRQAAITTEMIEIVSGAEAI